MQPGRERIAISERLMKQAKTESEDEVYLWNHLEIAVNGWAYDGASRPVYDELHVHYQDVYKRLADLIDPTCHVVPFDEESMQLPHCSKCGQPILKPWPNFCPCCGARIELNEMGDRG